MGPSIQENQNKADSLRLLAAQSYLYSSAKNLFSFQIFLTIIMISSLSFINIFISIETFIAYYSVIITIVDIVFINEAISARKTKAAQIQETFDTKILNIKWNNLIKNVDHEDVYLYSDKYLKKHNNFRSFENWYSPEIENVTSDEAKFICQYSNCRYDLSLKRIFNISLYSTTIIFSVLIILFAYIKGLTPDSFFSLILLPLLPVIVFFFKNHKDNTVSISALNKLKDASKSNWNKFVHNEPIDVDNVSRLIQDRIYENRKLNLMVFDWMYELSRKNLENQMNYSVTQLVKEYKESRSID